MRVLLTGAAGFVGRITLDLLKERHDVTAFDIQTVEGCLDAIEGDVLDYTTVGAIMAGHDAVVNTIMAPNLTYGGSGLGFTTNVTGVYNLLVFTAFSVLYTRRAERYMKVILGPPKRF